MDFERVSSARPSRGANDKSASRHAQESLTFGGNGCTRPGAGQSGGEMNNRPSGWEKQRDQSCAKSVCQARCGSGATGQGSGSGQLLPGRKRSNTGACENDAGGVRPR